MEPLSGFLAKFALLTPPDEALKKTVVRVLRETAAVTVEPSSVSFSRGTVFIACSSVAKSVIRAKRGPILDAIVREHPKARDKARDIR